MRGYIFGGQSTAKVADLVAIILAVAVIFGAIPVAPLWFQSFHPFVENNGTGVKAKTKDGSR
jgi:hypothetical protein